MLGQIAQVLAHLVGAGGTVQSNHVDAQRFQSSECRANFRPQQHRPGCFNSDVADNGEGYLKLIKCLMASQHRSLDLQQVLSSFNENAVSASLNHAQCGFLVIALQIFIVGVAQRRKLRPRPH